MLPCHLIMSLQEPELSNLIEKNTPGAPVQDFLPPGPNTPWFEYKRVPLPW